MSVGVLGICPCLASPRTKDQKPIKSFYKCDDLEEPFTLVSQNFARLNDKVRIPAYLSVFLSLDLISEPLLLAGIGLPKI